MVYFRSGRFFGLTIDVPGISSAGSLAGELLLSLPWKQENYKLSKNRNLFKHCKYIISSNMLPYSTLVGLGA
jgi:hypothetical protein